MKYLYIKCIIAVCAVLYLVSCDNMNDMHIGYLERGEKIYAAKVDSISPGPGNNRIEMKVFIYTQRIDRIRIFWNARSDSADFNIGNRADTFRFMIENLPEKEYLFEAVSFDKFGNRSLPFEVSGRTYGEYYRTYLLNRSVTSMEGQDGKAVLKWSDPAEGALFTTVYYKTSANVDDTAVILAGESEMVIDDYLAHSTFSYSTSYKPAANSPDLFESERATNVFSIFTYRDLDRSEWTSTQSHAVPSDASPRGHLDGYPATFLSMVKPNKASGGIFVPAGEAIFFIIDMKISQNISYFRILHRGNNIAGLRFWGLSIHGSDDGVNFFEIQPKIAIPDARDITVPETPNIEFTTARCRYVKVICEEWDTVNNGAVQMSEFYIGVKE
jgi:hypothetical protein